MNCPKCKTVHLKQGTVRNSGVQIDYCPQCKGFWLDKGEMKQICDVAIKELSVPPDAEQTAVCPQCLIPMFSFCYPQTFVTIDMCKRCEGLWFDAKELKEIELVRQNLADNQEIEEYDEVRGVKGWLIDFINNSISYLNSV